MPVLKTAGESENPVRYLLWALFSAFAVIGLSATVALVLLIVSGQAHAKPTYPAAAEIYRTHIIREAQFRFGIPAPAPIIAGQITQESAWNPKAKSRVGAEGLMQFMPATSKWAATAGAFGTVDPFNPLWSIRAGIWYDRWLYERIRTYETECDRWLFTLQSYNGGLGWTYKRQKKSARPGSYETAGYVNPGIHAANQHEAESYGPRIAYRHQPLFAAWGRTTCTVPK